MLKMDRLLIFEKTISIHASRAIMAGHNRGPIGIKPVIRQDHLRAHTDIDSNLIVFKITVCDSRGRMARQLNRRCTVPKPALFHLKATQGTAQPALGAININKSKAAHFRRLIKFNPEPALRSYKLDRLPGTAESLQPPFYPQNHIRRRNGDPGAWQDRQLDPGSNQNRPGQHNLTLPLLALADHQIRRLFGAGITARQQPTKQQKNDLCSETIQKRHLVLAKNCLLTKINGENNNSVRRHEDDKGEHVSHNASSHLDDDANP